MKPVEAPGVWWVPGSETEVAGTLRFSTQSGASLHLIGSLDADPVGRPLTRPIRSYPIVLGRAKELGRITLENCRQTSIESGAHIFQHLYAERAYVGGHYREPHELLFEFAALDLSHLSHWIGKSGLNTRSGFGPRKTSSTIEWTSSLQTRS